MHPFRGSEFLLLRLYLELRNRFPKQVNDFRGFEKKETPYHMMQFQIKIYERISACFRPEHEFCNLHPLVRGFISFSIVAILSFTYTVTGTSAGTIVVKGKLGPTAEFVSPALFRGAVPSLDSDTFLRASISVFERARADRVEITTVPNGDTAPLNADNTNDSEVSPPSPPINFDVSSGGPSSILISWDPPVDDGGSPITGYRIEWENNSTWQTLTTERPTARNYRHTGLTIFTPYRYRIRAINADGESDPTDLITGVPDNSTVPNEPRHLTAEALNATMIELGWSSPDATGSTRPVSSYRVEISPDGQTGWSHLGNKNEGPNTYLHSSIAPQTTNYYRVIAVNSVGEGPPSNVANATTEAASKPDPPEDFVVAAIGPRTIQLTWKAPFNNGGDPITGYRILVSSDGGVNWTELVANASAMTYTHRDGLYPNTILHCQVFAINSLGESVSAFGITITDPPDGTEFAPSPPTNLVATPTENQEIRLAWSKPSADGGLPITEYRIQVSPNGTSNWETLHEGQLPSDNLVFIDGSPDYQVGETYYYRVNAKSASSDGQGGEVTFWSPPSSIASATIIGITAPDAPTGLTATASGTSTINLSWTSPSDTGGAEITGYRIEVSSDGMTNSWTELQANTGSVATTYADDGLEAGTTRYYRVRAINAVGESTPSNVADSTTEAATLQFTGSTEDQIFTVNTATPGYVLPAVSEGVPPYVYTLTPDLSDGLTFDASTRTISGTPTVVMSSTSYTYQAADNGTTPTSLMFTIEIVEAVSFSGILEDQLLARGQAMDPLMFPEASGGAAPIRYELMPDLPEGLVFDMDTTRTLSGTPVMVTEQPESFKFRATDVNGSSDSLMFTIAVFSPVSIERASLPELFTVHSNYPNPFSISTQLVFDLPWSAQVTVEVMDLTGRRVLSLPTEVVAAGWERSLSLSGHGLSSGMYMYQLIAASSEETFVHTGSFVRLRW